MNVFLPLAIAGGVGVAVAIYFLTKSKPAPIVAAPVVNLVPSSGPIKVAMLGDSITALKNVQTTWPMLNGDVGFYNFGVPSENTSEILARVPALLSQNPKSVFLLGGVNDISTGLSREQTVANIKSIIALCQAQNVPIYVQAILMVTMNYTNSVAFNTEIDARNLLIEQATKDAGAIWLNWRDELTFSDFQLDGIHPALSGDAKWAAAILQYTKLYT